jgi:hypothetical protein
MVSVTPRPRFTAVKGPPVPIVQYAEWAPEQVWTQRLEEKFFARPFPGGKARPRRDANHSPLSSAEVVNE